MTSKEEIKRNKANCYEPNTTLNKILIEILEEWLDEKEN